MVLKPDYLIVFFGNRWWDEAFSCNEDTLKDMLLALYDDSAKYSVYQYIETKLKSIIKKRMDFLKFIQEKYNLSVLFLIPEVNLKDWKYSRSVYDIGISGDKAYQWYSLKEKVKHAYEKGCFLTSDRVARQMIQVAPYNPTPYEYLAKINMRYGNEGQAEKYYRQAFDTQVYRFKNITSSLTATKDLIKDIAFEYGIKTLDLQEVFRDYLNGGIPGKDMFLDDRHLSVAGIRAAMGGTALCLRYEEKHQGFYRADAMEGMGVEDDAEGMVLGKAHLLAAIRNQQEGNQPFGILYYHCAEALRLWEDAAKAMIMYIQLITAKVPWFVHKNYTELSKWDFWPVFPQKAQLFGLKSMENELVDAMVHALKTVSIDIKNQVKKYRIDGFGAIDGQMNLLEPYYFDRQSQYFNDISHFLYKNNDCCYYNEIENDSRFFLPADGKCDIMLYLTLKIPDDSLFNNQILIKLNQMAVYTGKVNSRWKDYKVLLPKRLLCHHVINRITIGWPVKRRKEYENNMPDTGCVMQTLDESLPLISGSIMRLEAHII